MLHFHLDRSLVKSTVDQNVLVVDDVSFQDLERIIHYLYTGDVPTTSLSSCCATDECIEIVQRLLTIADYYLLDDLRADCMSFLFRNSGKHFDVCFETYQVASNLSIQMLALTAAWSCLVKADARLDEEQLEQCGVMLRYILQ
jgi:hypothetical protein